MKMIILENQIFALKADFFRWSRIGHNIYNNKVNTF